MTDILILLSGYERDYQLKCLFWVKIGQPIFYCMFTSYYDYFPYFMVNLCWYLCDLIYNKTLHITIFFAISIIKLSSLYTK